MRSNATPHQETYASGVGRDFWIFWAGQTISNMGNAVTLLVIPLLIFKLTGSALNLAIGTASVYLPYLLFGLWIGAGVDRLDRRWVMIAADIGRTLMLVSVPALGMVGLLHIWWVYLVGFANSTLGIAFNTAEFASIPHLVDRNNLVAANGRIQASYSVSTVAGPLVAGVFLAVASPETVLFFDAFTFVVSILSLLFVRQNLNAIGQETARTTLRTDVVEGLRYVWRHPVLRSISIMMALVNFVGVTTTAQLVFFAKERFHASDERVSLLYSAGGAGVVVLSLLAGMLRRHWSFSKVALGALLLEGSLIAAFALAPTYWVALPIWALGAGFGILFNINTGSLRQMIVPDHLLGRVSSVAMVLAWSGIPVGSFLGGLAIQLSGSVSLVYFGIGIAIAMIAAVFSLSALGRAEEFLETDQTEPLPQREPATV